MYFFIYFFCLTAHSGFGKLMLLYDDQVELARALEPLHFCLDRRTGAVIVDDSAFAYAEELPPSDCNCCCRSCIWLFIGGLFRSGQWQLLPSTLKNNGNYHYNFLRNMIQMYYYFHEKIVKYHLTNMLHLHHIFS